LSGELLFLTQRIPHPPDKGDKIRSSAILAHLARRRRVHLGCFYDDPEDARHAAGLAGLCGGEVLCLPLRPALARLRSLKSLAAGEPLTAGYFADARMRGWVEAMLARSEAMPVFVYCSAMAPYVLADRRPRPRVIDMVDVDSEKWRQYAAVTAPPMRWVFAREHRRLLALERLAATRFDASLFVSEAEAALFRRLAPEAAPRVRAMSNGVDAARFSPDAAYARPFVDGRPALVFTGAMDYRPNVEAVSWFAAEVMPLFGAIPGPRPAFWIVGANPAAAVRRLSSPDVRVTGRVPDVRPYLAHAAAVVAPLRIARGLQNKVLEAMAMARPAVVTPAALEGIGARDGQELLVAADAPAFVRQIAGLLAEGGKRPGQTLGRRARNYVLAHHRWESILADLDPMLGVV
jgi:sugar transferase (PEP-CTERM/EpsH1 system associated)